MLFSHPELSRELSEAFECAWEELRPAPKVHIDFGNGHTLDRTLHGNVATLFCTADGGVFDVLPGITDVETYRSVARSAREHYASPDFEKDPIGGLQGANAELFGRRIRPKAAGDAPFDVSVALLKSTVEAPIEDALLGPPRDFTAAPARGELTEDDLASFVSKAVVELPIKQSLRANGMTLADAGRLAADTQIAAQRLRPDALLLLAASPLCAPEALTIPMFREVLHVDLEDPYLGLAPDVLGGRLGRSGPSDSDDLPAGVGPFAAARVEPARGERRGGR